MRYRFLFHTCSGNYGVLGTRERFPNLGILDGGEHSCGFLSRGCLPSGRRGGFDRFGRHRGWGRSRNRCSRGSGCRACFLGRFNDNTGRCRCICYYNGRFMFDDDGGHNRCRLFRHSWQSNGLGWCACFGNNRRVWDDRSRDWCRCNRDAFGQRLPYRCDLLSLFREVVVNGPGYFPCQYCGRSQLRIVRLFGQRLFRDIGHLMRLFRARGKVTFIQFFVAQRGFERRQAVAG